ncbi:MAG: sugar nucleotide-binding protein [Thermoleophilia bacterium]|nr:sugar nucleotide-binding protein [Thermoleophilia bacterium]
MKNASELLIVGAGGMLGTALQRVAGPLGYHASAYTEADLDITDRTAVRDTVAEFADGAPRTTAPGAVVNAAAYTDVERAEAEADRAFLVNGRAAGWLAAAAHEADLAFVHVSTDFVFDGTKPGAYLETDRPNPISVYGSSKLAGERAVLAAHPSALIVRTSWTYGLGGDNFPVKILRRARALMECQRAGGDAAHGAGDGATGSVVPGLQVVADEIGSPTYSVDLAEGLLALLSAGARGLYHLTGAGSCSRYGMALEALRLAGFSAPGDLTVEPVPAAVFPVKARRPQNSVLDCAKAAGLDVRLPAWQDGLARFLSELQTQF